MPTEQPGLGQHTQHIPFQVEEKSDQSSHQHDEHLRCGTERGHYLLTNFTFPMPSLQSIHLSATSKLPPSLLSLLVPWHCWCCNECAMLGATPLHTCHLGPVQHGPDTSCWCATHAGSRSCQPASMIGVTMDLYFGHHQQ